MTTTKQIPPHVQRMQEEHDELEARIQKLAAFTGTAIYQGLDTLDKTLLDVQHETMADYLRILKKRVTRALSFIPPVETETATNVE